MGLCQIGKNFARNFLQFYDLFPSMYNKWKIIIKNPPFLSFFAAIFKQSYGPTKKYLKEKCLLIFKLNCNIWLIIKRHDLVIAAL